LRASVGCGWQSECRRGHAHICQRSCTCGSNVERNGAAVGLRQCWVCSRRVSVPFGATRAHHQQPPGFTACLTDIGVGIVSPLHLEKPAASATLDKGECLCCWPVVETAIRDNRRRDVDVVVVHAQHLVVNCENAPDCAQRGRRECRWQRR
jgi:hypothetical protein